MSKKCITITFILVLALVFPLFPACTQVHAATGYTAIIPAVLRSSSQQIISVNLYDGSNPASGKVNLTLLKDGQEIAAAQSNVQGKADIPLNIPKVDEGDYTVRIKGDNFLNEAKVAIQNNFLIFLETDKPIYKPGQTIHIRVLTLDPDLKSFSTSATIEALDAKGIKIFRREVKTDEYGLGSVNLPISEEPNLGTWKINALTDKAKTQMDVTVDEYVLPKYEVKVDLPKDWYLVSEPVKGKVKATYSFGKPVVGDLEVKATKYVGTWQTYSTLKLDIKGEADFTVPPANYVAGVPAAGGNGNVKLEFTVTEKSTSYQQKTDTLLRVSPSSLNIQIIPSGSTFKPGLPYSFMLVTQTPDNNMVDSQVKTTVAYLDKDFKPIKTEDKTTTTSKGKAIIEINPPSDSIALTINCSTPQAQANKTIEAAYSPTSNFIHLEQTSQGVPQVGDNIKFWVYSTSEATNFYYEVIARGTVLFSNYVKGNEISFPTSPAMAPSAKLLVYQILPNSEVAADYLPFKVTAQYPQQVTLNPSATEAKPGDNININIQTEGQAEVGLAAVDKSVFILSENRTNLQQVFDELEKLYMNPQAELHEVSIYSGIDTKGAKDVFKDAGVIVLTDNKIPEGKSYKQMQEARPGLAFGIGQDANGKALPPMAAPMTTTAAATTSAPVPSPSSGAGLAEVQRVRQFFPETWIWDTVKTDGSGKASLKYAVPDTITTWMLRAVALSPTKGLGVAENQLKVFQPFFLSADLPYSAIRGEEFPVKVAIYNYLNQTQSVQVQIEPADWFDLLDSSTKTLDIKANDIGGVEFKIRPKKLGTNGVKISARSIQAADAVIKTLIVEPEGVAKEIVNNLSFSNGTVKQFSTSIPDLALNGSGRAYLAVTSSFLAQTVDGLDKLLQMPFGCGEQNMIVFAPDVYVTKYLQQSGQLKPEIMAKAEKLMLTGYQRELTYMRKDGSFSAFGQNDKDGSLWLTAFVLKSFSEAKGIIFIDDNVLNRAKSWILSHQNNDGSFDQVGFVIHQEMLGGLKGKTALSAYVAIALMQAGEKTGSAKSVTYLESQLNATDDPYTIALISYALELAKSAKSGEAHDKLMKLAKEDETGLHWGNNTMVPLEPPSPQPGLRMPMPIQPRPQTSDIEATAYATLALTRHGDGLNAGRAAKWLVSKRNAYGGYGSTQDTVVALQALTEYSTGAKADVDMTLNIESGGKSQQIKVQPNNFDILQIVEIPINDNVKISAQGKGEVIGQIVERFNLPQADQTQNDILKINVSYNADQVAVNDQVKVSVQVSFNPPIPMEAGMTVLDISVPTGFAAVKSSIDQVVASKQAKIQRYDISGRKVIFYIENMLPGDKISFDFMVQAQYPVKAKGVVSQAYSYYQPNITAESLSRDISIVEK